MHIFATSKAYGRGKVSVNHFFFSLFYRAINSISCASHLKFRQMALSLWSDNAVQIMCTLVLYLYYVHTDKF